jgi:CRP/FNR family transcriptional regulator
VFRPYKWLLRFFGSEQHWTRLAFFRGVSLFHGLSSRQLGRIMQAMQKRSYQNGEVLFHEGQVGKAVFIIESGRVELTRKTLNGEVRSLGILGPGQIFGEMALLEQMARTATATVVEDGVIYLLYTATLESLIRHHPVIGAKLMRNMAVMLSSLLRRTNKELDQHRGSTV